MSSKYALVLVSHLLFTAVTVKFINFIISFFAAWVYSCFFGCSLWICIAWFSFSYTRKKFLNDEIDINNRAVFITGCDTGFGKALAKRLDSKGFHVFATCLFPSGTGATELKESCSTRLRVLHMDVTKDDSVKKAFEYVTENLGSSELWAVVNNAGIFKGFSVEFSSIDDFRDCMDVNLFGCIRVTKTFFPLLKKTKGRIVNITSAAGEIPIFFITPYAASKYAAVGFTDSLRNEVNMYGISVISIEPELFKTGLISPDIVLKKLDAVMKGFDNSLKESLDDDFAVSVKNYTSLRFSSACPKISIVIDDLEAAVSLKYPYHTYKPRVHVLSRFLLFCYEVMPRSCQILLVKLAFSVFFTESKAIRNAVVKIIS